MSAAVGVSGSGPTADTESVASASSGSSQSTTDASRAIPLQENGIDLPKPPYEGTQESAQSTDTLKPGAAAAVSTAVNDANVETGKTEADIAAKRTATMNTQSALPQQAAGSNRDDARLSHKSSSTSLPENGRQSSAVATGSRHVSWHPEPEGSGKKEDKDGRAYIDIVALGESLEARARRTSGTNPGSSWDGSRIASEISRTPSQSTTGTSKTLNSLDTAASSLQSGGSSNDTKQEELKEKSASNDQTPPQEELVASPQPLSVNTEKQDMNSLRRYFALLELVQSECEYVEDLDILINVYFQHLDIQPFFQKDDARQELVQRNGGDLLNVHRKIASDLLYIVDDCSVNPEADGSDIEKSQRADEAIIRVAQSLAESACELNLYHRYCSMHAEADQLLTQARLQHSGQDFAAYERHCSALIQSKSRVSAARTTPLSRRNSTSSTAFPGFTQISTERDALASTPSSPVLESSPSASATASGATSPSGLTASFGTSSSLRQSQSARLRFNDYHIKPVQRLCRYSLFLNAILQFTATDDIITRGTLHKAIDRLDDVSSGVDRASLRRQKEIVGRMLLKRLERPLELSDDVVDSLGPPELIGVADVLHHHPTLHPLSAPLRFNRAGVVLWADFIAFVRVRRNKRLIGQFFFPLRDAVLVDDEVVSKSPRPEATREANSVQPLIRNAFCLTCRGHSFEIAARSERERSLWYNAIALALEGTRARNDLRLPSSFSELDSAFQEGQSETEGLHDYIANHNRAGPSMPSKDALVKFPSASTCTHFDRYMTFSDVFKETTGKIGFAYHASGGEASRDIYESVAAYQARQSPPPSISSTVVGLAKMATTQVPNAIRSRRASTARALEGHTLSRMSTKAGVPKAGGDAGDCQMADDGVRPSVSTLRADDRSLTFNGVESMARPDKSSYRLRDTFKRNPSRSQPKKSNTLPLPSMQATSSCRAAFEESRHDPATASPATSSPARQDSDSSTIQPDISTQTMIDSSSPAFMGDSGSEGMASPFFLTPSEELSDSPLPIRGQQDRASKEIIGKGRNEDDIELLMSSSDTKESKTTQPTRSRLSRSLTSSRRSSLASIITGPALEGVLSERSSAAVSPSSAAAQMREGTSRSLRRARSGVWARLSTFGPPVMMGPSSGSPQMVAPPQSPPTQTMEGSLAEPFSPRRESLQEARSSIEAQDTNGLASSSSSIHSTRKSSNALARFRGTLSRRLSARGKASPAPAFTTSADGEENGLGLMYASPEAASRSHSRRQSVVESALLTDSAVKLVKESPSEHAADLTSASSNVATRSISAMTPISQT